MLVGRMILQDHRYPLSLYRDNVNDPISPVPVNTFIVRIWLEWSKAGSCWRGQIVHAQSGNKSAFLTLDKMLRFIQDYSSIPESDGKENTEIPNKN